MLVLTRCPCLKITGWEPLYIICILFYIKTRFNANNGIKLIRRYKVCDIPLRGRCEQCNTFYNSIGDANSALNTAGSISKERMQTVRHIYKGDRLYRGTQIGKLAIVATSYFLSIHLRKICLLQKIKPSPLQLSGTPLPWASSATHLGHENHESGDMDTRIKRWQFIDSLCIN